MTISKETAMDIAYAHREIETAEALLADIVTALEQHGQPDIRNAFGRRPGGMELSIPNSCNTSQRLFNVPWTMAKPIIEAHIAHHRNILAVQSEKALIEARGKAP